MLSKKDLENIRQIVREELKGALVRTVTIERGPEKQGDPEKVIREEEWNVLDFSAAYAPKIEAALRGMQADVDQTNNMVLKQAEQIEAIGGVLCSMEQSALKLAKASDTVTELKLVESNS